MSLTSYQLSVLRSLVCLVGGSAKKIPSSTFRSFPPLPRPLPLPLLPLLLAEGLVLGLAAAFGVDAAAGRLLGSFTQQSLPVWPGFPQWLHFTGCGQSQAIHQ